MGAEISPRCAMLCVCLKFMPQPTDKPTAMTQKNKNLANLEIRDRATNEDLWKFRKVCGTLFKRSLGSTGGRAVSAARAGCVIKPLREGLQNSEPRTPLLPSMLANPSMLVRSPLAEPLVCLQYASVIHLAFCLTHSSSHSVSLALH